MKTKIKVISLLLVLCLGVGAIFLAPTPKVSHSETIEEGFSDPLIKYDFPFMDDLTEMPILGYVGVPGAGVVNPNADYPSFLTRPNLQAYKDAGFNILSGLYEKVPLHNHEVQKALKLCEELELVYFVNDNDYLCPDDAVLDKDEVKSTLADKFYFDSPAFGGIATKDEPSVKSYPAMSAVSDAISELTNRNKIMYTNLFPKGACPHQLGLGESRAECTWEEYTKYVTDFVSIVKPTVLPYDCYAMIHPNAQVSDLNGPNRQVGYYIRSLSLFRNLAKKNNIPFWVTVASFCHVISLSYIPYKQTAWTVNTSLAYGAKGVQYYTYWNNDIEGASAESWADNGLERGLVSVNGAKHDAYYRIQAVNNQIKTVDHVLMQADHQGVMQFGTQHLELMPADTLYSFGPLVNIVGDAFVGCFMNGDNYVYYIVNNDVNVGLKTFKADFQDAVNVRLTSYDFVSEQNPTGQITYDDAVSVGFNLAGGDAILLEVLK